MLSAREISLRQGCQQIAIMCMFSIFRQSQGHKKWVHSLLYALDLEGIEYALVPTMLNFFPNLETELS